MIVEEYEKLEEFKAQVEVLVKKLKKEAQRSKMWAEMRRVEGDVQPNGFHINMNYAQGIEHTIEELERII